VGSQAVCVFCRKHPVEDAWRPFCSERCRLLDLARWVDGAYRVPAEPVPSPDEDGEDEPGADS
jgi:uncharacterized protein